MSSEIKLGKYRHFKGNMYEVIGVGKHSETGEELVIYKALYDVPKYSHGSMWIRPLKMFLEKVEKNGKVMPRFEIIS